MGGKRENIQETVKRVVAEALQDTATLQVLATLIRDQVVQELKETITKNTSVIEELRTTIQHKDEQIAVLERRVDDLEQYSRRQCLRIFGVEEKEGEDTDKIVMEVAEKVGATVVIEDIDRSHRVGVKRNDRPRPVIVKFVSYRKRSEVFVNKRKLKGTGVTVREDLTKSRYNVLQEAIKKHGYQNVWTMDGAIIVKSGDTKRRVTSLAQLN